MAAIRLPSSSAGSYCAKYLQVRRACADKGTTMLAGKYMCPAGDVCLAYFVSSTPIPCHQPMPTASSVRAAVAVALEHRRRYNPINGSTLRLRVLI